MLSKLKPIRLVLITIIFLYVLILDVINTRSPSRYIVNSDFVTYITAARMLKSQNTLNLYKLEEQFFTKTQILNKEPEFFSLFLNTPITAVPFISLLEFDLRTAFRIYTLVTLCIFLLTLVLLQKEFKLNDKYLVSLTLFAPIFASFSYGQITPFIFLFLVITYLLLKKNKNLAAGLICGLISLKLQYLIIIPLLAVTKNKTKERVHFISGVFSTLLIGLILNIFVYGPNLITDYTNFLTTRPSNVVYKENLTSFNLFAFKTFASENLLINNVILVTTITLYLIALYLTNKSNKSLDVLFSSSIIFAIALNYHAHIPDLLYLIFPIFVLFSKKHLDNVKPTEPRAFRKFLITLALIALFTLPVIGEALGLFWLCALFLLLISYGLLLL